MPVSVTMTADYSLGLLSVLRQKTTMKYWDGGEVDDLTGLDLRLSSKPDC